MTMPLFRESRRLPLVMAAVAALLLGAAAWWSGVVTRGFPPLAPVRVEAIGHNWWWEFQYPEAGFRTANELHLPENRAVEMNVTAVEVAHALAIPELGLQVSALPGAATSVKFRTGEAGTIGGECTEICGIAHNMMRVRVVIEPQATFEAWQEAQRQPAAVPESEEQWRGYEMVTTACAQCHSLNPGEQKPGLRGPNLAHLMSRSVFAGAMFELNETNLRRWVRDTQAMKEGNDMVVDLPKDDYEAVIEYLLMLE